MRLVLNSRGMNTLVGSNQIRDAIYENGLANKSIFVVSYPYYEIDEYIMSNCVRIGFKEENVFFIKDGIPSETVDFVYVTEGNTFVILDYMRRMQVVDYIKETVKTGATYIGSSAGAMIAGTDIRLALDFDSNDVGMREYTGLGLLDGAILPHYTEERLRCYISESDCELVNSYKKVYSVDDDNVLCLTVY